MDTSLQKDVRELLKKVASISCCYRKNRDVNISLALQDILAALRGYDHHPSTFNSIPSFTRAEANSLKEFTTARLRAIVTPNFNGTIRQEKLSKVEQAERDNLLNVVSRHFFAHWRNAVLAVAFIYDYNLDNEGRVTAAKKAMFMARYLQI